MDGIGKLMLRATVGTYFVGHGLQKLSGWFGGDGPDGTGEFFESIGLRPGRQNALLAGAAELGGGTMLALGFLTPLGAAAITGVMTNAIRHVHAKNGVWNSNGGVELPGAVATALALGGGAAAAVYVAERGEQLFEKSAADAALSRAMEYVGAES